MLACTKNRVKFHGSQRPAALAGGSRNTRATTVDGRNARLSASPEHVRESAHLTGAM